MALCLSQATCDDLLYEAVKALVDAPPLLPAPTKGACRERTAVTLELTNPLARISQSVTRGRPFSALGELAWYLSGSGQTTQIEYYIKDYTNYDNDGVIDGAYGPRLRSFDDVDQLLEIIKLLRRKPSSRQAVIQLYDHTDLTGNHADVPCTCVLQFLVRDGKLQLIVFMRSNDVYLGLPHDLFCFTMIQEVIARSLGVDLGTYTHVVGSLHLYDSRYEEAKQFLDEGLQSTRPAMPPMPEDEPMKHVTELLAVEEALRNGVAWQEVELSSDNYWADLGRMYAVYQRRKGPFADLATLNGSLHADFYQPFILQYMDRLKE